MAGVVLLRSSEDAIVPQRARWRDRIVARWRAAGLDAQLAAGVPPAERITLALHAQAISESHRRSTLAQRIHHVLRQARAPSRLSTAQVPLRRRAILAVAEDLEELASRLLAPGPVGARGIAKARLLLIDGCSPLYFSGASDELRVAVADALAELQPSFAW